MPARDLLQKIDIPRDQLRLGGNAEPQAGGLREGLEHRASDSIAALSGLIGIGRSAQGDGVPLRELAQFTQERRAIEMFGVDAALEIQRVAQLHEFMGVTGIAVLTAELAAAVGVDAPLERNP